MSPPWETMPRMLRDQAARHPDAEVIEPGVGCGSADGDRLTMADLREGAAAAARGLMALGVRPGDRVALWGRNDWRWAALAFAVWDVGGVLVPLSTRYKKLEAADLLRKTGARVLYADEGFMGISRDPCEGLTHVTLEGLTGDPAVPAESVEARAQAVRPDDLCQIISTSGTTGRPRGVMLDHATIMRGYWDWSEIVTLGPDDRYPVIAPFAHGFGLNAGLVACVMRRATMLPIPVFDPDALLGLLDVGQVSILAGPPTLFHRLLEAGRPIPSLRVAICGAAAVPAELIRRLLDHVGLERMINAYGLMEGTVVSMTRADDPVEVIATSTGRPVPGVDVKLGKDDEILVRGYNVMRGYWGEPEKTAEVIDEDGWLHTGDVGRFDAVGNLAIVDRLKEIYICGGFNVSPAEVESLLLRSELVSQAAVVGVPDERMGEVGCAFVVPAPGGSATPDTIIEWAKANVSGYKVPRRVHIVEALPVNANGKVDKQALRSTL